MFKTLFPFALLVSMSVYAQPLPMGTIDVYFQQLSKGGVPDGCSLVFTTNVADTAYLKGAQVTMNGSIAVRSLDGKSLSFTGKLGTRTFEQADSKWVEPVYFYFSTKNGTSAGKGKVIAAETQGYKLLIANAFDESVMRLIVDIAHTGNFTVGFNRKTNGQDVYSPVDVSVSLKQESDGARIVKNLETKKDFEECFIQLLGDLKAKLNTKPSK